MSSSTVKVSRDKRQKTAESSPLVHSKACSVGHTLQAAADVTIPWPPGSDWVTAVHADGGLRDVYVW